MFKPLTMCLGVRPARLDSMHREPRRFRQWNLHHLNTKSDPLGLHLFYCLATPTPHNPVSGFGQVSEKTSPINYPSKIPYIWNVSILSRPIYQMKIHPQTASKVQFACLQNCCLYRSSYITCLELSYYHKTLSSK